MLFYDGDGDCGSGVGLDPNLRWCLNAPLAFMLNTSAIWDGISRLSFFITYSNDVDAARACMFCGDEGAALWREYVSTWISAMRHPHYMKVTLSEHINPASPPTHTHIYAHTPCFIRTRQVGGRPVFQILIPDVFSLQCGGNNMLADALLDDLRFHLHRLRLLVAP